MISVRLVAAADARSLFEWRNDPTTRGGSLSQDEIAWDDHVGWFESVLASTSRVIYVADDDGLEIGMVRFDLDEEGQTAEVSINLAPHARGTGRSGRVLAEAIRAFSDRQSVAALTARIRDGNIPSIRMFSAAGFVPNGDPVDGVGSYVWPVA